MKRLTNKLNGKAYLICSCPDGEYFQQLIDKLAEYEELEEQGLIKRNDNPKIKNDEIYYKTETEKKSIVGI